VIEEKNLYIKFRSIGLESGRVVAEVELQDGMQNIGTLKFSVFASGRLGESVNEVVAHLTNHVRQLLGKSPNPGSSVRQVGDETEEQDMPGSPGSPGVKENASSLGDLLDELNSPVERV